MTSEHSYRHAVAFVLTSLFLRSACELAVCFRRPCCVFQATLLCVSGDLADLIFVFFDPIGQALCKRTLNLVERLNERHAERMRFYLSKADEAGHEADRQVRACVRARMRLMLVWSNVK